MMRPIYGVKKFSHCVSLARLVMMLSNVKAAGDSFSLTRNNVDWNNERSRAVLMCKRESVPSLRFSNACSLLSTISNLLSRNKLILAVEMFSACGGIWNASFWSLFDKKVSGIEDTWVFKWHPLSRCEQILMNSICSTIAELSLWSNEISPHHEREKLSHNFAKLGTTVVPEQVLIASVMSSKEKTLLFPFFQKDFHKASLSRAQETESNPPEFCHNSKTQERKESWSDLQDEVTRCWSWHQEIATLFRIFFPLVSFQGMCPTFQENVRRGSCRKPLSKRDPLFLSPLGKINTSFSFSLASRNGSPGSACAQQHFNFWCEKFLLSSAGSCFVWKCKSLTWCNAQR